MRIPIPKFTEQKPEIVKWPTVDFDHDMAETIAKGKKKKKKKKAKPEDDFADGEDY